MTNTTLLGNCHCKNIEILFEISKPPQELWVRKCPCSFCTKQGNLNIADPDGWDRSNDDFFDKKIKFEEYSWRKALSTTMCKK